MKYKIPKLQQILATALCGGVSAPGNSISENLYINLGKKSDLKELPVLENISHRKGGKNITYRGFKSRCSHKE